jgi:hypothetical protein
VGEPGVAVWAFHLLTLVHSRIGQGSRHGEGNLIADFQNSTAFCSRKLTGSIPVSRTRVIAVQRRFWSLETCRVT